MDNASSLLAKKKLTSGSGSSLRARIYYAPVFSIYIREILCYNITEIFQKEAIMRLINKIAQYTAWKNGVKHCTFNPEGPGVVRMHLIPPKFKLFGNPPFMLILNGYYILPLGYSWAILLSAFIDRVNEYDNREITEDDCRRSLFVRMVQAVMRLFAPLM